MNSNSIIDDNFRNKNKRYCINAEIFGSEETMLKCVNTDIGQTDSIVLNIFKRTGEIDEETYQKSVEDLQNGKKPEYLYKRFPSVVQTVVSYYDCLKKQREQYLMICN